MKEKKSIVKFSILTIGLLHCINKGIEYSFKSKGTHKCADKTYNWRYGKISYNVKGKGKPLLLIHDIDIFSGKHEWDMIVRGLSKYYTVYTIDLLGCGKSEKPSINYTNYIFVELITDFTKNIINEKTKVIASGLSSTSVIMANELDDSLFESIIMINPPSLESISQNTDTSSKIVKYLFEIPIIGKSCYYIITNKTNTEDYLTDKCFYNPFDLKPAYTKSCYDAAHAKNGNGKYLLSSITGKYLNVDISKALKNSGKKLTVIFGEYEEHKNETIEAYEKLNQEIKIRTIKESKKFPQIEKPEDVFNIIMEM